MLEVKGLDREEVSILSSRRTLPLRKVKVRTPLMMRVESFIVINSLRWLSTKIRSIFTLAVTYRDKYTLIILGDDSFMFKAKTSAELR